MSSIPISEFTTCEISDAMIKLGVPHGGHLPDIHCHSPERDSGIPRLCGPAYTVKMVMTTDKQSPKLSSHFVDTAPSGSVIVIDAPPQAKNAVWGGLMTAGAQARGARGVIISGRCRDLSEHRAAKFPVFARGHSTLGQSPFTRPSAVNVPLRISPLYESPIILAKGDDDGVFPATTVKPGDIMVADEDGVVCVPVDLLEQVAELAQKGREVDGKCLDDIRAGWGVQETFKTHRG